MLRFAAGFVLASALWGAFLFSYKRGWIDISLEPEAPQADAKNVEPAAAEQAQGKPTRTHRKRVPVAKHSRSASPSGYTQVGDDLRENEARSVNMAAGGGEEQLRETEIEQAFDGAFGQIRRCLILAAGDEPAQGKLVFGLRITGEGKVSAVNLSGPATVAQGDCGACLRKAVSSMHFRTFHGPDMVVHYPLTLE